MSKTEYPARRIRPGGECPRRYRTRHPRRRRPGALRTRAAVQRQRAAGGISTAGERTPLRRGSNGRGCRCSASGGRFRTPRRRDRSGSERDERRRWNRPGNEGALALLSDAGSILDIADVPCVADGVRGRQTVNPALLAAIIRRWAPGSAFCEYVGPRPTDAKIAAFAFGRCRGVIEGTLAALGVPVTMLTVPTWRRAVGLPVGATKEMSRGEAIRRFPDHAAMFARVRDDGRAESVLIAVAGLVRQEGGRQ